MHTRTRSTVRVASLREPRYGLWLLLAAALAVSWYIFQPFVSVLLWAGVLGIVFAPLHARVRGAVGHEATAAVLSTLVVVLTLALPLAWVSWTAGRELRDAVRDVPHWVDRLVAVEARLAGAAPRWLVSSVGGGELATRAAAEKQIAQAAQYAASLLPGAVGGVGRSIGQLTLVLFVLFFVFRDGGRIRDAIGAHLPLWPGEVSLLCSRTCGVLTASVFGVLMVAAAQGVLGGIAFAVLGLPSPVFLAVLMAFASLVPIVGTFLVWGPASAWLLLTGHVLQGVLLLSWGVFVVSMADNALRSRFVGGRTGLHDLLIFFAVLGGVQMFGFIGLFLGPAVAAITLALVEFLQGGEAVDADRDDRSGTAPEVWHPRPVHAHGRGAPAAVRVGVIAAPVVPPVLGVPGP